MIKTNASDAAWPVPMLITAVLFAGMATRPLFAQDYPVRPIRIVVAVAAAGPTDILARIVAQKLVDRWGQAVIVDNRPGGGQVIGAELVARAQPDGYTLLMGTNTFAVNPALFRKLPFDSLRDFAPVTLVAEVPLILVVHPSLPVKSLQELIDHCKARPGQVNYASSGASSSLRLAAELLQSMAGITLVHVPYKGSGPAATDLIGGQVQMMFGNPLVVAPHVKAGKLRAIAVTSERRLAGVAELPTMSEAGLKGYVAGSWFGLLAPGRTPRAVVDKLNAEVVRILRLPDVEARIAGADAVAVGNTPQAFEAYIRAEMEKWGRVIRSSGITPD